MKNLLVIKKIILGFSFLLFLFSCEVDPVKPANTQSDNVIDEDPTDEVAQKPDSENPSNPNNNLIMIGNGYGHIELKDIQDKIYTIKPGTYSSISLSNLKNITIDGLGKVIVMKGTVDIDNVDGLTLSGISIEQHDQAAIYIHTAANNLTIKDIKLKNISNYGIRFDINKKYDGSPQSFSENILLENIQAENIGTLFWTDPKAGIRDDGFYGLIKRFKLTKSKVINSPYLNGLTSIGCAEDYEMSYNIIDNVNASDNYPTGSNNHTGIFYAQGNGKIFGNKATNYQGNLVRAWLFSITKPGSVEIYNNIAYNTTRYGAFELQVPPSTENLSSFKPADAKIYNNTVGKLNTGEPKYFQGRLLDLYQTYGSVEIYNNLGFELRDDILINDMSNPQDTKITRNDNNQLFKISNEAVLDLISFKSKIPNVGAL